MPDTPEIPRRRATDLPHNAPADLRDVAQAVSVQAQRFSTTVTEVAAGSNPEVAIPLLLLAVSDVLAAGARLGAMVDVNVGRAADAEARIAAQATREQRLAIATHVIDNTGTLEDLRARVDEVHAELTAS